MARRIALILGTFGLASSAGWAQSTPAGTQAAEELKALADTCAAHKFETMVVVDGSGRAKRVKICGEPGQTDAEWLVTLRDSLSKVETDAAMAQAVKAQIVAALKTEIAQLESVAKAPPLAPLVTVAPPPEPVLAPEAAPQYSSVPTLPAPVASIKAPAPTVLAPAETPRYSSVPPLPAPMPRATMNASSAAAAAPARPRLTVSCALPGERFGSCARIEQETRLLVRADENLGAGTSLRFVRGGDQRAELQLGQLQKGGTIREKLPARVCSGVLRGKVEVQIVSKNQVADTLGPYALYCGS